MNAARPKLSIYLGRHRTACSGLWVYGRNLVCALDALTSSLDASGATIDLEYLVGGSSKFAKELAAVLPPENRNKIKHIAGLFFRRRLSFFKDLFLKRQGAAVIHGTANFIPIVGPAKKILSLHDLFQAYPFEEPKSRYEKYRTAWYKKLIARMVEQADVIVTVHPSIAAEIQFRLNCEQVPEVVYPALDPAFVVAPLPSKRPPKEYVLTFASFDKRKNIAGALAAFASLQPRDGLRLKVMVVAKKVAKHVNALAEQFGIKEFVDIVQDLPTVKLAEIYAGARAVLFPSHAEAFGYPIYEALSQGTPVVCNRDFLIPELRAVTGELIVHCDTATQFSVLCALERAIASRASQDERSQTAKIVRKVLHPKRSAEQMLVIYKRLLYPHPQATPEDSKKQEVSQVELNKHKKIDIEKAA